MRISKWAGGVSASLLALLAAAPALGAPQPSQRFDIPADDLRSALQSYGLSTGQQVLIDDQAIASQRSRALKGEYTPDAALRELLKGTGFEASRSPQGVIYLRPVVARRVAMLEKVSTEPAQSPPPPPPPPLPAADAHVEEVVVTAQRRGENLQSVPIVVTAVTAQKLEALGTAGTRELQSVIPGLQFNRNLLAGLPTLRGVGTNLGALGDEAPTAVYVDDVYMANKGATMFAFNNIQQVSVLKGPQGTLFGRNATGGVIQITTRKPSERPEMKAELGLANYKTLSGALYATDRIADNLAGDIAFSGSVQDKGWGRNLSTGKEVFKQSEWALRSSLLWTPSQATEVRLAGFFSRDNGNSGTGIVVYPGALNADNRTRFGSRYDIYAPFYDPRDGSRTWSLSLKAVHQVGAIRLASITGYTETEAFVSVNQSGGQGGPTGLASLIYSPQAQKTMTQEVHIASDEGPIKWIVGGFFLRDLYHNNNLVGTFNGTVFAPRSLRIHYAQDTHSYAGFGQATAPITDTTRLTLGARYTKDRRETASLIGGATAQNSKSWSKLTWRAAIDHDITDDVMVYASWNRGFKSGIFNVTVPATTPPAAPETIDAYEIGAKTEFFDRRLRVNVGGFWYDHKNLQVRSVVGALSTQVINNAARSRNRGIDVDIEAAPTDNLNLTFSAEYLDARYREFNTGLSYRPFLTGPCPNLPNGNGLGGNCTVTQVLDPATGAPTGAPLNLAGNRLPKAPKLTFAAGFTYTLEALSGEVAFSGKWYHNSGFRWDPDNRLRQPSYDLLNTSIGWTARDGRWGVRVWGKNLTDERYFAWGTSNPTSDYGAVEAPRTYGVTFKWNYR